MTIRHICSWQHKLLQEEDGNWRSSLWSWLAFGKETLPAWTAEMDMQNLQWNDCWTCLKVRRSFGVTASWKNLPDILQDTEENYWQTVNIGRTVFEISCFMEKSSGYYGPVGWRWMPQWYRKTLSDCPDSKMSLSIPEYWKLFTMYFLFT